MLAQEQNQRPYMLKNLNLTIATLYNCNCLALFTENVDPGPIEHAL